MGIWVAAAIALFVLGSIMALKPTGIDVRLDKLRMTARRIELHPKLITCPDWVRGKNNEFGAGMIGQYALIVDGMKLPEARFQAIDGELRAYLDPHSHSELRSTIHHDSRQQIIESTFVSELKSQPQPQPKQSALDNQSTSTFNQINFSLDHEPIELPNSIAPFIKAVYTKANSLVVYWHDSHYVMPNTNPNYNEANIESDLLALKQKMSDWAHKVGKTHHIS